MSSSNTLRQQRLPICLALFLMATMPCMAMNSKPDKYKIVLLGDGEVGKTKLVERFVNNKFVEEYKPTVGADLFTKELATTNGRNVKLLIWDFAGQERFQSLENGYMRNTSRIVLCYDPTNRASFDNLEGKWQQFICNALGTAMPPIILCGTKSDVKKDVVVTPEEANEMVQKLNASSNQATAFAAMTSAKTGEGVEAFFQKVAETLVVHSNQPIVQNRPTQRATSPQNRRKHQPASFTSTSIIGGMFLFVAIAAGCYYYFEKISYCFQRGYGNIKKYIPFWPTQSS